MANPTLEPVATFELRPASPLMSEGFGVVLAFLSALTGATLAGGAWKAFGPPSSVTAAVVCAAVGAIMGVVVVVRSWRRLTGVTHQPPIAMTKTAITFPKRTVPIEEITSIEENRVDINRSIVIGTKGDAITLSAASFIDPAALALFLNAVRTALADLPNGRELLTAMAAREKDALQMSAVKPRGTFLLLVLMVVAFAAEFAVGLGDKAAIVRLGANAPALVVEGQWWRLFCANFLHIGWLHIYLNGAALLSLGALLEKALGIPRFIVVALLAGIVGNVVSTLFGGHAYSAGASAMIFGMLGALLAVNVLHRGRLPASLAITKRRWAVLLGINLVISLLPFVDGLAHAGGAVAGALVMLATARRLAVPNARHRLTVVVATILAAAYVAGFAAAVLYATSSATTAADDLSKARFGARGAAALNDVAWDAATDGAAPQALLTRAEEASRRAIALAPDNTSVLDTRAYVLHRLGRTDEALALEREAAWRSTKASIATMLLRMLQERGTRDPLGQRFLNGITVSSMGEQFLVEDVPAGSVHGAVIYAVVEHKGPVGLLRIVLPAMPAGTSVQVAAPDGFPGGVLRVLFWDSAPNRPERADAAVAWFAAADSATLALPWP